MPQRLSPVLLAAISLLLGVVEGLPNGLCRTPPMGYNSYMAGDNADGVDLLAIASFFVSSGLVHSGYEYVNSDEGWEQKQRDAATHKIVPGPKFGGSDAGLKALVDKIHGMGLKIGLVSSLPIVTVLPAIVTVLLCCAAQYGAASAVTCGTMPGQLYNEDLDAQTYADWKIDCEDSSRQRV
jgi:alpha-galactosidase